MKPLKLKPEYRYYNNKCNTFCGNYYYITENFKDNSSNFKFLANLEYSNLIQLTSRIKDFLEEIIKNEIIK